MVLLISSTASHAVWPFTQQVYLWSITITNEADGTCVRNARIKWADTGPLKHWGERAIKICGKKWGPTIISDIPVPNDKMQISWEDDLNVKHVEVIDTKAALDGKTIYGGGLYISFNKDAVELRLAEPDKSVNPHGTTWPHKKAITIYKSD